MNQTNLEKAKAILSPYSNMTSSMFCEVRGNDIVLFVDPTIVEVRDLKALDKLGCLPCGKYGFTFVMQKEGE